MVGAVPARHTRSHERLVTSSKLPAKIVTKQANYDVAVCIGRFQPFHNAHLTLLQHALELAPKVVVVLGSAMQARSSKNPFEATDRAAMISLSVQRDAERVTFVPMRDYYDDSRWLVRVKQGVAQAASDAQRIAVIGHFKDATSFYLDLFQGWADIVRLDRHGEVEATHLRRVLLGEGSAAAALAAIEPHVPEGTLDYLRSWMDLPFRGALAREWAEIRAERERYGEGPFTTVDSVVTCGDRVLLVQRGGPIGHGLWALPGGFLEKDERLRQAALRELQRETGLKRLSATWEVAYKGSQVFDHPQRSVRGRAITHAHRFDLGSGKCPEVQGADDAAHAQWVPISELASIEARFFEDHFHILDHFLELTD